MGSRKHPNKVVEHDTLAKETHMQMMRRLGLDGGFAFKHGHPGPRKPKKGK